MTVHTALVAGSPLPHPPAYMREPHSCLCVGQPRVARTNSLVQNNHPMPGASRTILLFHTISARPSKQPLMVRTFLKVYMELGSYFLFLQEQIKDIIILYKVKIARTDVKDRVPFEGSGDVLFIPRICRADADAILVCGWTCYRCGGCALCRH